VAVAVVVIIVWFLFVIVETKVRPGYDNSLSVGFFDPEKYFIPLLKYLDLLFR
jgi:hypothetical protein